MRTPEQSLDEFGAWLGTRGYASTTVCTYKSAIRLVLGEVGDDLTQERLDAVFVSLETSSRYGVARSAWTLFQRFNEGEIPKVPEDRRRTPQMTEPSLPSVVLQAVRYLKKTQHLTNAQLCKMRWADLARDENANLLFPHPKDGHPPVIMDAEIIDILRDYAQPNDHTPLVPFEPGGSVPFPLEVILSGR